MCMCLKCKDEESTATWCENCVQYELERLASTAEQYLKSTTSIACKTVLQVAIEVIESGLWKADAEKKRPRSYRSNKESRL